MNPSLAVLVNMPSSALLPLHSSRSIAGKCSHMMFSEGEKALIIKLIPSPLHEAAYTTFTTLLISKQQGWEYLLLDLQARGPQDPKVIPPQKTLIPPKPRAPPEAVGLISQHWSLNPGFQSPSSGFGPTRGGGCKTHPMESKSLSLELRSLILTSYMSKSGNRLPVDLQPGHH